MSGQLLVFSESIDDVLKVVQETPRGRWFVEAYAQRLKGEGTSNGVHETRIRLRS